MANAIQVITNRRPDNMTLKTEIYMAPKWCTTAVLIKYCDQHNGPKDIMSMNKSAGPSEGEK